MARIQKVQPIVLKALEDNPETRVDDYILVLEVYKHFTDVDISLKALLENHIALGLPSFASILRTRRKLQRKYPDLVDTTAAAMREGEREEYRNYALNS